MSVKKNQNPFHITTPDIRSRYVGTRHKQKVTYLQLPEDFGEDLFRDDIKNGATIYEPLRETLKLGATRYNVITAPTTEDGLRAVAYLAGIHARISGYDAAQVNETYEDDRFFREVDLDVEYDWNELFTDDGSESDEEEESSGYEESFDRIPVIDIRDVVEQDDSRHNHNGFGMWNLQMQGHSNRVRPYWLDCVENSVCVIKDFNTPDIFNMHATLLEPCEIDSLKRFSSNEWVYFVVVDENISKDDLSLTTALLDYTANCLRVDQNKKTRNEYYCKLLLDVTKKHGFTFSKNLDLEKLTDNLRLIDPQHPCDRFYKIMDYLTHVGAPHILKEDHFSRLGLKVLANQLSKERKKVDLDQALVGMESVKKQVTSIMDMLRFTHLRARKDLRCSGYHNVHLFIGAPGTAKTTVAKMMADDMAREGLISGNRFISVTGAQLKGAYVGQTAPKIHSLFMEYDAIFIDEAYSLACSMNGERGMDTYSQEALAQLAVELEEHAMDKLVIFAGYGGRNVSKKNNLMHQFLMANPGISSRINSTIYFDSYTPQNMVQIIHHLAKNASMDLPEDKDDAIAAYFATRQDAPDFGNGREARVFLENCEKYVAGRVAGLAEDSIGKKVLSTITGEDVQRTICDLKEKRLFEMGAYGKKQGFA